VYDSPLHPRLRNCTIVASGSATNGFRRMLCCRSVFSRSSAPCSGTFKISWVRSNHTARFESSLSALFLLIRSLLYCASTVNGPVFPNQKTPHILRSSCNYCSPGRAARQNVFHFAGAMRNPLVGVSCCLSAS